MTLLNAEFDNEIENWILACVAVNVVITAICHTCKPFRMLPAREPTRWVISNVIDHNFEWKHGDSL